MSPLSLFILITINLFGLSAAFIFEINEIARINKEIQSIKTVMLINGLLADDTEFYERRGK